jgi:hypothetical protein
VPGGERRGEEAASHSPNEQSVGSSRLIGCPREHRYIAGQVAPAREDRDVLPSGLQRPLRACRHLAVVEGL